MSNVNKPVIPVEVADAIERLRDPGSGHVFSNAEITTLALHTGGALPRDTVTFRKIPFDTLLAALVNGYERELTEEERGHAELKRAYLSGQGSRNWYHEGYADGIRFTISTLGINIEGVNA